MSQFRFSPKANRAHEIHWNEWGKEAFDKAKKENKPVLLAISGVWCHWCHVMDETSYSNDEVIETLNSSFVPVRVDTDMRPDINERYNLGGWPTTAVVDGDGNLLSGGTYIPPEALLPWLEKVAKAYKGPVKTEKAPGPQPLPVAEPDHSLLNEFYDLLLGAVHRSYDPKHHGFGTQPKFPMVGALELCLDAVLSAKNEESRDILVNTLEAMSSRGMYDLVEGGFFRYSTTRDWKIPHFEKMLEDNAGLLSLLARASRIAGAERLKDKAYHVLGFLKSTLYTPEKGWAGTQDADEEYYKSDREGRKSMNAPFVDRTFYTNWNAQMAKGLLDAYWELGDSELRDLSIETLDNIVQQVYSPGKGVAHYMNGAPTLWGRLEDAAWTGWALSRAFQTTANDKYLEVSRKLADFCLENLKAPQGGFHDSMRDPEGIGKLADPSWHLEGNSTAARWLRELGELTGHGRYTDAARSVLAPGIAMLDEYGIHAASFALVCAGFFREWTTVKVPLESPLLLERALSAPKPQKVVVPNAGQNGNTAYVCVGNRCLEPVTEAEELSRQITGG